jgi:fatty acid desaturase
LQGDEQLIACFLFSAAVGMVCSCLFVSEILYVHNQITVIFWLIWGFLFYFYDINHEKEDKVE